MAARDASVPPVRVVVSVRARSALGRDLDRIAADSRLEQGRADCFGKIERRLSARVRTVEAHVEQCGDLRTDWETTSVKTRSNGRPETLRLGPGGSEAQNGVCRDPPARTSPAAVDEGTIPGILVHERDGCAISGRNRDPGVPHADQESIGLPGSIARLDDCGAMDLVKEEGAVAPEIERARKPTPILKDCILLVADSPSQIERGECPLAYASVAGGKPKPGTLRKRIWPGAPEGNGGESWSGVNHRAQTARREPLAQVLCALLLMAGCARIPAASSAAEARARFVESFAGTDISTRGAGMISIKRSSKNSGSINTRWGAVGESLVIVGYAGPVRTLDATILGDSVYIAVRPYDLGLAGLIPADEGLGAHGLRFLARPWEFDSPWIHDALGRAGVEPAGAGWRLIGRLDGAGGPHTFVLELNAKSEPKLLRIQYPGAERDLVTIRYGSPRRYQNARIPHWIEWTHGATQIRLEIEEHAHMKEAQFRHTPRAEKDWKILAIDDPRSRDLLRRLLGAGDEEPTP